MPQAAFRSGATNPITRAIAYSDVDMTFIAHPVTGRAQILHNNDAVTQGVKTAVLLNRYESPYQPYLGDIVQERLFENFGDPLSVNLRRAIENAIANREPRAEVLDINILGNENNAELIIRIAFRVRGRGDEVTLDVALERIK